MSDTERKHKYKTQHAVIIICADEADQEKVYYSMQAQGYKVRVVNT